MKCEKCKYKRDLGNTKETGAAICVRIPSYFPVNCEDDCHFIPGQKELHCEDCSRFGYDPICFSAQKSDKVYENGKQCNRFIDKKEEEFVAILKFWKGQGWYERAEIDKLINRFEEFYAEIEG